jgi:hypothetical protein
MLTAVAIYCMVVGTLMLAWWAIEVGGGALRRPDRTAAEITLHLAAEILTAVALVGGGAALLRWPADAALPAAAALGMLLYTAIQSPGYFLARREPAPVAMFGALVAATLAALVALLLRGAGA